MQIKGDFMKNAFTMSEVLISLAIIGVIATLTIPNLITQYNLKFTETALLKFYSAMNKAILLSSIENGPISKWTFVETEKDETGTILHDKASENEVFITKYLLPHLNINITNKKIVHLNSSGNETLLYYLSDGSSFAFTSHSNYDLYFFPKNGFNCLATGKWLGRCGFAFRLNKSSKGMEAYKEGWNETRETLFSHATLGCKKTGGMYCTAIIEQNNWKIPDDYPVKIRY